MGLKLPSALPRSQHSSCHNGKEACSVLLFYNFLSSNCHILEWSLPREIISAPLLFSGSLLYEGRHQLSSKKQFRKWGCWKGEPKPIYKLQSLGRKLLFLTLGSVRLTYISLLTLAGMTSLEGQDTELSRGLWKALHRGAVTVRHQTPNLDRQGLKQKVLEGLSKGNKGPQVGWRGRPGLSFTFGSQK